MTRLFPSILTCGTTLLQYRTLNRLLSIHHRNTFQCRQEGVARKHLLLGKGAIIVNYVI